MRGFTTRPVLHVRLQVASCMPAGGFYDIHGADSIPRTRISPAASRRGDSTVLFGGGHGARVPASLGQNSGEFFSVVLAMRPLLAWRLPAALCVSICRDTPCRQPIIPCGGPCHRSASSTAGTQPTQRPHWWTHAFQAPQSASCTLDDSSRLVAMVAVRMQAPFLLLAVRVCTMP